LIIADISDMEISADLQSYSGAALEVDAAAAAAIAALKAQMNIQQQELVQLIQMMQELAPHLGSNVNISV